MIRPFPLSSSSRDLIWLSYRDFGNFSPETCKLGSVLHTLAILLNSGVHLMYDWYYLQMLPNTSQYTFDILFESRVKTLSHKLHATTAQVILHKCSITNWVLCFAHLYTFDIMFESSIKTVSHNLHATTTQVLWQKCSTILTAVLLKCVDPRSIWTSFPGV